MDLLALVGLDSRLRKVANTAGGEYHGPCPLCGGTDRFSVRPHAPKPRWYCRQCTPKGGNAIDYLIATQHIGFKEAVAYLGGPTSEDKPARKQEGRPMTTPEPKPIAPPDFAWQAKAAEICSDAVSVLESETPAGLGAMAYLRTRGLMPDTIKAASLGYVPKAGVQHGIHVSQGITIPWYLDGEFWQIKIRHRTGTEPKYGSVQGGHPFLYVPGGELPTGQGGPLVLVEGEFDALLLWQQLARSISVASLGSASAGNDVLSDRIKQAIGAFNPILVAYDNDAAGMAGSAKIVQQFPGAHRLIVPQGNDVTDFVMQGGSLTAWIQAALARVAMDPAWSRTDIAPLVTDRVAPQEGPVLPPTAPESPAEPDWAANVLPLDPPPTPEPLVIDPATAGDCDAEGCFYRVDGERDPSNGGWCEFHSERHKIMDAAWMQGYPLVIVEAFADAGPGRDSWWAFACTAERDQVWILQAELDAILTEKEKAEKAAREAVPA